MLTIKTKIILAYTLVFGLMLTLFALVIHHGTKEAGIAKIDARLETRVWRITDEIEEDADEGRAVDWGRALGPAADGIPGERIRMLDRSGGILVADSLLALYPSGAWQGASGGQRHSEVLPGPAGEYRSLWVPVKPKGEPPAVIQIAVPMTDLQESLEHLRLLLFVTIPLALFITALAAYVITRLAFRPMLGMVETSNRITAKNLHERLTLPAANDEVRLLGETLNRMIGRIDAAFNSQRQFVADASHEIRTPLTVICSELEYAAQRVTDPSVKESIQTSLSEIDRLTKLSDDLLLLAKLDADQLQLDRRPVRLDELLTECVQRVSGIAEKKNIRLRITIGDIAETRADRDKMKSIILNLLDNAVKYSPSGTVVVASLALKPGEKGRVLLAVTDEGPGIPEEALPHIFKRFYRIDPSRTGGEGSGLGLAIVERLVELHGGTVSVRSTEGKGSEFTVELPAEAGI